MAVAPAAPGRACGFRGRSTNLSAAARRLPKGAHVIPWDTPNRSNFAGTFEVLTPQERTQQNRTRAPLDESPPARVNEVVQETLPRGVRQRPFSLLLVSEGENHAEQEHHRTDHARAHARPLMAACTAAPTSSPSPSVTPTPTLTIPTLSPVEQNLANAEQAVVELWSVVDRLTNDPQASLQDLDTVASGNVRTFFQDELRD